MCDRKTSNSVASMAHVRATFVVEMLKKDLQPNVNDIIKQRVNQNSMPGPTAQMLP